MTLDYSCGMDGIWANWPDTAIENEVKDNGKELVDYTKPLKDRSFYTPDFDYFRRHKHTLIFNYMPRFSPNREYSRLLLPGKSAYLGKAYTIQNTYVLKETMSGIHSAVFRQTQERPKTTYISPLFESHVKGDLYALCPEAILNLDRILGHCYRYSRERVFVIPKEQEVDPETNKMNAIPARMYFGIESYWENFPMRKGTNTKDSTTNKWMWT